MVPTGQTPTPPLHPPLPPASSQLLRCVVMMSVDQGSSSSTSIITVPAIEPPPPSINCPRWRGGELIRRGLWRKVDGGLLGECRKGGAGLAFSHSSPVPTRHKSPQPRTAPISLPSYSLAPSPHQRGTTPKWEAVNNNLNKRLPLVAP